MSQADSSGLRYSFALSDYAPRRNHGVSFDGDFEAKDDIPHHRVRAHITSRPQNARSDGCARPDSATIVEHRIGFKFCAGFEHGARTNIDRSADLHIFRKRGAVCGPNAVGDLDAERSFELAVENIAMRLDVRL